ncbi:MAG: hypothetical protein V2I32_08975 [Desulforhopalus sp.]|jgi:hypothetical protein|nr:hypothetical protein [Desulforhopalus sp.]
MTSDELTKRNFLDEVYRQTDGDPSAQVSMYEAGAAIGLEKSGAGLLAEGLMVEGLVELRTLAGGISITDEGMACLGYSARGSSASTEPQLSTGELLTQEDRDLLAKLNVAIHAAVSSRQLDYALIEELVIDLKTIEVQLLSPRAKTMIIREVLRSLQTALTGVDPVLAGKLGRQL